MTRHANGDTEGRWLLASECCEIRRGDAVLLTDPDASQSPFSQIATDCSNMHAELPGNLLNRQKCRFICHYLTL